MHSANAAIRGIVGSVVWLSLAHLPAAALPTTEATVADSNHLLPLASPSLSVDVDLTRFQSVEDSINAPEGASASPSNDVTDLFPIGLLGDLVDENGEVQLPFGLTIFSTMGDTSLGFGGDF